MISNFRVYDEKENIKPADFGKAKANVKDKDIKEFDNLKTKK